MANDDQIDTKTVLNNNNNYICPKWPNDVVSNDRQKTRIIPLDYRVYAIF